MTILCGTDLSAASGGALAVARVLASMRGEREIILAHVMADGDTELARVRVALDAMITEANGISPRAADVSIRIELVVGDADSLLVDLAESEGCDLIVIAARSSGGTGSLLRLGTTAERVVAAAQLPVLIIRDATPWLEFAKGERPLRVLLGMDDSATCEIGVQWTHALRQLGMVDVVLGAIYYPDVAAEHFGLHGRHLVDRDPEIERLMSRDLLRRFGDPTGSGQLVARPRRGLGRIGDHMLELARDESIDLIIVGTSQKTGLGRLGSVSTVVVHDATQAVLCIPPGAVVATQAVPVLRSALVATDLSPFANRAVPYAFATTPATGEVHLVHVVDSEDPADDAELARALVALAPRGATQTVVPHVVRGGDAATAIAQIAARLGVDVICIASHGRAGLTRALMGSIADRLLRVTRLPVLVLRPLS